jgi:hypothetical protein
MASYLVATLSVRSALVAGIWPQFPQAHFKCVAVTENLGLLCGKVIILKAAGLTLK